MLDTYQTMTDRGLEFRLCGGRFFICDDDVKSLWDIAMTAKHRERLAAKRLINLYMLWSHRQPLFNDTCLEPIDRKPSPTGWEFVYEDMVR